MDVSVTGGNIGVPAAAPKGRRFGAAVIDLIIIPIVLGLLIGFFLLNLPDMARTLVLVAVNIGWFLFRDTVFAPGRAVCKLKLISLSGGKVTLGQAFIRNILLIFPYVLIFGYIVEIIAIAVNGERVADRWAKTRIVANS